MHTLLCPVLVGRDAEREVLLDDLARAATGHGRVAALLGEAGLGKSRLTREIADAATARGLLVLAGRAVPAASPTAYRPLTEAFLAVSRAGQRPRSAELAGFDGQLARLVPGWGTFEPGGPDENTLLVGEAVLRLLRALAADRGCLLVLEDLHWADAETIAVLDYLADNIGSEPVLCLATSRPDSPAVRDVLERARTRTAARVVSLSPLQTDEQRRMVAACLDVSGPPADVAEFVTAHSDGVPFLVEELLAGVVSTGALAHTPAGWQAIGRLTPSVPVSLAESVRGRLAQLGAAGRQVLGAAAVFGRRFDWSLVPGVAGVDAADVVDVLRAALATQLIIVDGQDFRFRHALTREVVLAELLPPERAALSGRALQVVRRAHPGLPGAWCELAADLAEAAGEGAESASLLVESARRALARGALVTARGIAERALSNAPPGSAVSTDADEVLVQILVQAGDVVQAQKVGDRVIHTLHAFGATARRIAEVQILLVRAAIATGDGPTARRLLADARAAAFDVTEQAEMAARLDALAAHVELDAERLDQAEELAEAAVAQAARAGLPAVECEALEVLGRVRRLTRFDEGVALVERAVEVAERHSLVSWRLRALQELMMLRATVDGPRPLVEMRAVAADAGALIMVAQLDLVLAEIALGSLDADDCEATAQRCIDASRRYGLATLPVALLWLAGAHALRGDRAQMEAVLAEAIAVDPADQRIAADAWGRVRAIYHAVREERDQLLDALDRSAELARSVPPSRSLLLGRMLWVVLHAMRDDDLGAAARAELAGAPLLRIVAGRACLLVAEAIACGRAGDRQEAEERFSQARALHRDAPTGLRFGGLLERYGAEAAVRDGWGQPAELLRELAAFYAAGGYERLARACRALLAKTGAPVPRRGRGDSVVPPHLRAIGVTSRELDVLKLVVAGRTNREIGERLYLSTRTVDNHVASLLRRTGAADRSALAAMGLVG